MYKSNLNIKLDFQVENLYFFIFKFSMEIFNFQQYIIHENYVFFIEIVNVFQVIRDGGDSGGGAHEGGVFALF